MALGQSGLSGWNPAVQTGNAPFCLLASILASFRSGCRQSDPAPNTYRDSTAWGTQTLDPATLEQGSSPRENGPKGGSSERGELPCGPRAQNTATKRARSLLGVRRLQLRYAELRSRNVIVPSWRPSQRSGWWNHLQLDAGSLEGQNLHNGPKGTSNNIRSETDLQSTRRE